MNIQFTTDKNLTIHAEYEQKITEQLTKGLDRFSDYMSSVLVHLSDENNSKEGLNDKKCVLEVRLEGRPAVVGTDFGDNYDLAIAGALSKVKSALTKVDSKLKAHH